MVRTRRSSPAMVLLKLIRLFLAQLQGRRATVAQLSAPQAMVARDAQLLAMALPRPHPRSRTSGKLLKLPQLLNRVAIMVALGPTQLLSPPCKQTHQQDHAMTMRVALRVQVQLHLVELTRAALGTSITRASLIDLTSSSAKA